MAPESPRWAPIGGRQEGRSGGFGGAASLLGGGPLHGVLSSEVLADGGRGCKVSQCWHKRGPSVAREVP